MTAPAATVTMVCSHGVNTNLGACTRRGCVLHRLATAHRLALTEWLRGCVS